MFVFLSRETVLPSEVGLGARVPEYLPVPTDRGPLCPWLEHFFQVRWEGPSFLAGLQVGLSPRPSQLRSCSLLHARWP